ncbi:MAG: multiheme c-type cytochrome [Anaerolineales bacterium]|jgi:predicted CXXCH cytochrome family protein|nr:multiheme c-type cytochrome [Anaerolineales bacterium]
MINFKLHRRHWGWLTFTLVFGLSLFLGALFGLSKPANAAPAGNPPSQATAYAGSQACAACHKEIHTDWTSTRHAHAFSSPIFQRDWSELSKQTSCLQCHTTGFNAQDGSYAEEGVTCEACHGPFQPDHPAAQMPIKPTAELCASCHKSTTDEWRASPHSAANVRCQSCHNPHAQTPMADSITALCTNCHKERGDSFTHSTHASVGLECSNCHMYTAPREGDPIGGLVSTGHTFSVGSEACIGCHQDTVHTRDELVKLGGVVIPTPEVDVEELQRTIQSQEELISNLRVAGQSRLYTGLIQGAVIGLVTGGAAAWIVSRRIRVIEVEENE